MALIYRAIVLGTRAQWAAAEAHLGIARSAAVQRRLESNMLDFIDLWIGIARASQGLDASFPIAPGSTNPEWTQRFGRLLAGRASLQELTAQLATIANAQQRHETTAALQFYAGVEARLRGAEAEARAAFAAAASLRAYRPFEGGIAAFY